MSLASQFLDDFLLQAPVAKSETQEPKLTIAPVNEKTPVSETVEELKPIEVPFMHGNRVTIVNGQYQNRTGLVEKTKGEMLVLETSLEEKFHPHFFPTSRLLDTVKIKDYYGKITNIQAPTFSILINVKELDHPLELVEPVHNVLRVLFYKDQAIERNKEQFISIFKDSIKQKASLLETEDEKNAMLFASKFLTSKMYPRNNAIFVSTLLNERKKLETELQKESSIKAAVYQDLVQQNEQVYEAAIVDAPYLEVKTMDEIMGFLVYRMQNFGSFKSLGSVKLEPQNVIGERYIISNEDSPYFTFYGTLGTYTPLMYIVQSIVNVTVSPTQVEQKDGTDIVEIVDGSLKGKMAKIIERKEPFVKINLDDKIRIDEKISNVFFHDVKTQDGIVQVNKVYSNGKLEVQLFSSSSLPKLINDTDVRHYLDGFSFNTSDSSDSLENDSLDIFVHEPINEPEEDEDDVFLDELQEELQEESQGELQEEVPEEQGPQFTFSYKDKDRLFRMDEALSATQKTHKENIQKILSILNINDSYVNLSKTIKDSDEIQTIIKNRLEREKLDRLFRQSDMKLLYIVLIYKQLLLNLQPIRTSIPEFDMKYIIKTLYNKASGKITSKTGKSTYLSPSDITTTTVWLNYKWFKFSTSVKELQELYNTEKFEEMFQLLTRNVVEFISDLQNTFINLEPTSKPFVFEANVGTASDISTTEEDDRRTSIRNKLVDVMKKTLIEKLNQVQSELSRKGIEFVLEHIYNINEILHTMKKDKEDYMNKLGNNQYQINVKNLEKVKEILQVSFDKYKV